MADPLALPLSPVSVTNRTGGSPFLLVGDHAGKRVPRALAGLGVSAAERARHIGWDIGVAALGARLSARMDATFIAQRYSRLVIDCNRDPQSAEAIVAVSDGTVIPGNAVLSAAARAALVAAIHAPYHAAIAACIARRAAAGQPTVLIALHSFTPQMGGQVRPWEIGVLHDRGDTRFALALLAALQATPALIVGDNQPYRMDGTDFTVPLHAFAAGLAYAELEIRQDLLAGNAGIDRWCDLLATALTTALPLTK